MLIIPAATDDVRETVNPTSTNDQNDVISPSSSVWRRWLNAACGLPDANSSDNVQTAETHEERMKLLRETTKLRRILNVNAVLGLSVVAFLIGFFH